MPKSLQERFASHHTCFGCGQSNSKGLQLKSYPLNEKEVIASFTPQEHHQAFPGVLNGGIIGTLLDCHSNWTASYLLMQQNHYDSPAKTVTASFSVQLKTVTPLSKELTLKAHAIELKKHQATIYATIECDGEITATCEGLFVEIRENHPAFQGW